jgi:ketosteroid isomerase-like protein
MTPIRMERLETGIHLIIALTEAINRRDLSAMLHVFSENCVFEPPSLSSELIQGKPAISSYWQEFFTRYPQAHFKIEEVFGFGTRCISRWSSECTDTIGTVSHLRGADLIRIRDGQITEQLSYYKV